MVFLDEIACSHQIDQVSSRRDNRYIRLSGIGDCRRKIAYRLMYSREGRPEPLTSTHGMTVFEVGHGLHLKIQERLSNVGPLKWVDAEPSIGNDGRFGWKGNCEIPLRSDERRIAGTCDGLTHPLTIKTVVVDGQPVSIVEITNDHAPDGKRYVIDIKTISARESAPGIPSSFERLTEAKTSHIHQATMYAWLMTQPGFRTDRISEPLDAIPDLMIIYVAKDLAPNYYTRFAGTYPESESLIHSPYKIFTKKVSTRTINHLLAKAALVWDYVDNGNLPPRDYHSTANFLDFNCRFCPFNAECYREEGFFGNGQQTIPPKLGYRLEKQKA